MALKAAAPALVEPERALALDQLVGHRAARGLLRRYLTEGALPQALLIAGPAGVGKLTLAWALVREIVAAGADPATHHGSAKIGRATHPDVWVCDGSGSASRQIVVDEIRDADDWAATAPLEAPRKFIVIDPAERMNPAAANCLLKLLEEPPTHLLLILVSSDPGILPPTIRSRCTAILLEPVSGEELVPWLMERTAAPRERAELVAHLAEGRPGHALALLQGDGLEIRRSALELLAVLRSEGFIGVFGVADRLSSLHSDPATVLRTVLVLLRDALCQSLGAEAPINRDLSAELAALAEKVDPEGLLAAASLVEEAMGDVGRFYTPQARAHFMEVLMIGVGRELRRQPETGPPPKKN